MEIGCTTSSSRCAPATSRHPAAAALLLATAVILALSPASGEVTERIWNAGEGRAMTRTYTTHAEVEAAAAARGSTVRQFLMQNTVRMENIPFQCTIRNETQTVYFSCSEKTADNLCKGNDVLVTTSSGTQVMISGAVGVDVCTYTTCLDMECKDSGTLTAILQTVLERESRYFGCACLDPATGKSSLEGMYYKEVNPNFPHDSPLCSDYYCENASFPQGGTVVYEGGRCMCWYPRGYQFLVRWLFPALPRSPGSSSVSPTPDPIVTETPAPVIPTLLPSFDVLNTSLAVSVLCPTAPTGLTPGVFERDGNEFCCTVFLPMNSTWRGCGAEAFQMMPMGWAYCRSTIPSYEFCCEVERMEGDMFVHRGVSCFVHDAAAPPYSRATATVTVVSAIAFVLLTSLL